MSEQISNRVFVLRKSDGQSAYGLYGDNGFVAVFGSHVIHAASSQYLEKQGVVDIQEVFVHEKHSKFSSDPILRELVEETIAKSHREWRSIPETTVLVLKAIEDYGVGK